MILLVDVEVENLVEVVERDRLIALRSDMQTIETVLVRDVLVSALLDQHLANFNIAVE